MNNFKIKFFILNLFTLVIVKSQPIKVPILNSIQSFSCEQAQISQNENGYALLSDQQTGISQLTIVGWYRLLGNSNQNYLLIQARNSLSQNLIRIVYNPFYKEIYCRILDIDQSPLDISSELQNGLKDNWFFIKIGINLNDLNSSKNYIFYAINSFSSPISQSSLSNSPISSFDNSQFEYLYGAQTYYPFSRSCSGSKQILAIIGASNDSSQGPFQTTIPQEMAILAKQIYYFDFIRASSKNSQIFNSAPEYQTCYGANSVDKLAFPYYLINSSNQFITDYSIDFIENMGIIMSFDLEVKSSDPQFYDGFLTILNQNQNYPLFVCYHLRYVSGNISDQVYDINSNQANSASYPIQESKQYLVTIIFQEYFGQLHRLLFLNNQLIFDSYFLNTSWRYLSISIYNVPQAPFSYTDRLIQIKSFKLYQGSFFSNENGCNININNYDCFQCQNSNQSQQLSQQYACVSSCNYPYTNSTPKLCLHESASINQCSDEGKDLFQSTSCSCPDGQYVDPISLKCSNCLYYCKTCQTPYTCDTYLFSSEYKSQCDKNTFDDETQCISSYLVIPNQQNQKFLINSSQIICSVQFNIYNLQNFIVEDKAFNLGWDSNSFFFTLNFKLEISQLNQQNIYTICYLMNSETHIFSIISSFKAQNSLQLKILINQNDIILEAYIEADKDIWLGLYYDSQGINLIVKYETDQISYYQINRKNIINKNLDDPYLVVGIQSPLFENEYPLCGQIGTNNWVIQGDQSMRNFFSKLLIFSEEDIQQIIDFNFLDYQFELEQKQLSISNKLDSSITMKIDNINFSFDFVNGLMMTSQNQCSFKLPNTLHQTPFTIMLQIKPIYYNQCENYYYNILTLYNSNVDKVIFKIKSDQYLRQQFFLEVCTYNYYCKRFQNAFIKYQQPNNLFIQVKQVKVTSSLTTLKFDVVINYVTDVLEMEFLPNLLVSQPTFQKIILGDKYTDFYLHDLINENLLFYSRIQVFLGGYHHLNFDNNNPCFIQINRKNMTCIYPKKNYAIKDGVSIPKEDCNQENDDETKQILYYNENIYSCQNSQLTIPNCLNVNIYLKTCIQCIDNIMTLPNCQCPDGMYIDKDSKSCKQCSSQCLTCSESQTNCLECKKNLQIPPQCDCLYSNYYKVSNFECKKCSAQCKTCYDSPDQCLTCSEFRINPPLCDCDTDLYYLDSNTNTCQNKSCPNKCKTCNQLNQCIQCRGDRIIPPDCACSSGYYDDQYNEYCQKCQSGYYYDLVNKQCSKCYELCESCFGKENFNCATCLFNLNLNENKQCVCPSNYVLQSNFKECYQFMDLKFSTQFKNNNCQLILEFDYEIDNLFVRIESQGINNLFNIHISELDSQYYKINEYLVQQNSKKLIINLQVLKDIQQAHGQLIFQDTTFFYNSSFKSAVNPKYNSSPLSFLIVSSFKETTSKVPLDFLQIQNDYVVNLVSKFQMLFYVINSVQPTCLFLMLDIQYPPNLYEYLSRFGKYIFRNVEESQGYFNDHLSYTYLGFDLTNQVEASSKSPYNRLGFSNSIIINCELILIKYSVIAIAFFIFFSIQIKLNSKQKFKKAIDFLIKRLSQENEVNLLMLIISICIQIQEIQQDNYISRWSFYISITMLCLLVVSYVWYFRSLNSNSFENNKECLETFYERFKINFSDQNLNIKGWLLKNYYFLSLLKKVLLLFTIYIFKKYPSVVCYFGCFLCLLISALTIYLRPYKQLFASLIRLVGEILLTITWILLIIIIQFNKKHKAQIAYTEEEIENYLSLGLSTSIILSIFNILFLFNFIIENILTLIYQKYQKFKKTQAEKALIKKALK